MTETSRTVHRIVDTIGDLPASPAVVGAVMNLTSDLNSTITDITRVLSADQSLTAKVLRLSNSSFYGRAKEVGTLAEAIIILGFFTVRSLVVASSAHSMYCRTNGLDRRDAERLWQHSLSTGIAARCLIGTSVPEAAEEAFIAGLLHDIGKLVLMQKTGDIYREIVREVECTGAPFSDLEHEHLGFDHCDVAGELLASWAFPATLTRSIVNHHDPARAADGPVIAAVQMGNEISRHLKVGFAVPPNEDLEAHPAVASLNLEPENLPVVLEAVREQYTAEAGLFEEA